MNTIDPRKESLAEELTEVEIPDYLEPAENPELLSVDDASALLEHTMIQTILNIMESGKRDADRRAAARDAGELIGKLNQKSQVNLIKADNVQMNQIAQNPRLKNHLLKSASGLSQMTRAHDSGIKTKEGGSGV